VSYDIAVWAGALPHSDIDAAAQFVERMDASASADSQVNESIMKLVSKLTDRWPEHSESSPWAISPLIGEARGDFIYIPMTFSGAALGVIAIANEAARLGLICFDPQDEVMLN
jgi:hypothetical protein